MNKQTNIIISTIAALALVFSIISYTKTPEKVVGAAGQQGPKGEQGIQGEQGDRGERGADGITTTIIKTEAPKFGAVTGPELTSPFWRVNGLAHEYRTSRLIASTTPCSLRSPSATSTLLMSTLMVTTSTSTATVWTAAKSTTGFSTTTAFDQFSLASGAQGGMFVGAASSTAPDELPLFAPNTFMVWGVQGTTIADTTKLNGTCQAEFVVL